MSSKTIKLVVAIIIAMPVMVVALAVGGVLTLRPGSEAVVAAPVEVNTPGEPIMLGQVDVHVELSEPTSGAQLLPQQDLTRSRQLETVQHLATSSGPFGTFDLFTYDEISTDIGTNRETLEHCIMAYQGVEGGGVCSPDGFDEPQHVEFHNQTERSIEVALYYASAGAEMMTVETKSGQVISSNLVNSAGFVQYDSAMGQPKWITLFNSSGLAIWTQQVA